ALLAGFVVLKVGLDHRQPPRTTVAVSGSAALATSERPHFIVRAPGIGAAQIRAQVSEAVAAHHGALADQRGALVVRIPRAELLPLIQSLHATYKLTKTSAEELDPAIETIVIRFELE